MSDNTTIPFFDEIQTNSTSLNDERRSLRLRNSAHVSDSERQDNESTVTVNDFRNIFCFFLN